ncbi:MAG: 4a-hydroxytetrahydrobiopterin dehydratase [Frankiaceae bacterium]|jgi:4a-hydroxytetrahydrobiopterin dehydratase|nr:4a-hydroxytetrahydrobiopterin dehydratase [Frankiaceae bacterium]
MATLLDDRLVTDALRGLEEWTGGPESIRRTVTVEDTEGLLAAVSETADSLNHHPDITRDGNAVTFTLSTHSEGGVTELDIALASRIDDLVLMTQHLVRDAVGQVHSVDETTGTTGATVTATPAYPTEGETTPARPAESATGDATSEDAMDAPLMNQAGTPHQDAGPIVAPDPEPGSIEPQPGNAPAPGMHERAESTEEN